ncbi:acyl carrier protein [Actinomadura sp. WMMA1423]|uniref:acyl carrier protein n=1 Tax=Actinomadura sp. WMMA1423 TaxID=2591108 RepID=UPI00197A8143|nr:acyl carrier protein [Actinomadura sp. WMMA1423]
MTTDRMTTDRTSPDRTTADRTTAGGQAGPATDEDLQEELTRFLETRTKTTVAIDYDLFASGLVTSMFAMELVVHLEQLYGVVIVGPDLKLDNFRTIERMSALVRRLRGDDDGDG